MTHPRSNGAVNIYDMRMMRHPVVVGLWLRRERRNYVGRKKWMEEEHLGAKGDVVNASRALQSCGTVMAPSTFVNVWVWMYAFPVCSRLAFPFSETQAVNSAALTSRLPRFIKELLTLYRNMKGTSTVLGINCHIKYSSCTTLNCTFLWTVWSCS